MNDLRLGVAGLGMRKGLAAEAHRPGQGAQVTDICDIDTATFPWARATFGQQVSVHTDFDALLSQDLDAVLILTPDDSHRDLGERALHAKVATFMEKPLAITTDDCDALLETARTTGTRLYVGHNMRHMPVIRTMRDLIVDGAVGEVEAVWCRHFVGHGGDFYYKDWHADRTRTTGLLLQKGAHDIDVIHWLAGATTRRVTAMGKLSVYDRIANRQTVAGQREDNWYDPDGNWPPLAQTGLHPIVNVEDLSMMLMQLSSGVQASYQQCHYTPDYWRNYTVIGTHGRLENQGDSGGNAEVRIWNRRRRGYDGAADTVIDIPPATGGHAGADSALVGEFLDFVRHGGVTDTSVVAARDSVAAGVAATESLRDNGTPRDISKVDPLLERYFAYGQSDGALPAV